MAVAPKHQQYRLSRPWSTPNQQSNINDGALQPPAGEETTLMTEPGDESCDVPSSPQGPLDGGGAALQMSDGAGLEEEVGSACPSTNSVGCRNPLERNSYSGRDGVREESGAFQLWWHCKTATQSFPRVFSTSPSRR